MSIIQKNEAATLYPSAVLELAKLLGKPIDETRALALEVGCAVLGIGAKRGLAWLQMPSAGPPH